jgi:crotonobetaine/carnitine-CoA ligase
MVQTTVGRVREGTASVTAEVWISGEQQTVNGLLDRRLADDPHGEYLDVCGTKLSAAEVASAANRLANTLAAMGVRPGDRVATLVENSAEAMLAWWGIVRGGAVAVPINTAYKGEYLRHQLTDSGSRVLIVEASLADRVARISQDTPALEHVVVIGGAAEPPGVTVHTWDDALGSDDAEPGVTVRPADLATFIYTGGTTGPSKGCMLSHNYHEVLTRQIGICWRRTADEPRSTDGSRCRTSGPR